MLWEPVNKSTTCGISDSAHRTRRQRTRLIRIENRCLQQTVTILAEHRRHPDRIVHRQANEPAEQQIVVQLFHQQTLRTDGVKRMQQHSQQMFGRDRGASILRVERGKLGVEGFQRFVGDAPDQAKRVVVGNPALWPDVAEKSVPPNVVATHSQALRARSDGIESDTSASGARSFQVPRRFGWVETCSGG
jgi:hypothetical protein